MLFLKEREARSGRKEARDAYSDQQTALAA